LEPFRNVIEKSPAPNAISALENMDQNAGCPLTFAADMFLMLTRGILQLDQVEGLAGTVIGSDLNAEVTLSTFNNGLD
jgi:hypothetical protein